jgi:transcriptional regulator with PAS, ATPase and Fis domain
MMHVAQFLSPPEKAAVVSEAVPTLAQARARAETRAILEALTRAGGNREQAARLLRVSEATLYRKLGRGRSQDRESPSRRVSQG